MDWIDWLLLVARIVVVFAALLLTVLLVIWLERKVIADMQTRIGPNRAGPAGVLITLADGVKLFFKEGITPTLAERPIYLLAPILAMFPAFLAFAVIPFGTGVTIAGRFVPFQVANLNVGVLWVLAMGSLMVYGIVLAGWASGSNYPLLGSIRSSAQMISYEVGMGLAIVAVVMYSGTLNLNGIVAAQDKIWNVLPQFPAFLIYAIAGLAETNRPPFDLPEAESELVAGYHTEYSGIKFAMFFLGEYLNTVTVSAIAVTLFLGGWRGPIFSFLPWLWPLVWFLLKLVAMLYVYIWVRATLPRFRYDRLMSFGWKVLIPFGLIWVLATGAVVVIPEVYSRNTLIVWVGITAGVLLLWSLVWPLFARTPERTPQTTPEPAQDRR
jgi:NADH-quinone oxidoreductase subunit H